MNHQENRMWNYPPSHVAAARRDRIYFMEMMSPEMQRVHQEVDRVLDQYEYEGSPLFDEYPDKNRLLRLGDMIYQNLWPGEEPGGCGNCPARDFLQALLFKEIFHRRCRYRRYCR